MAITMNVFSGGQILLSNAQLLLTNLNWPLLWNLSVTIDWWFFDKKYFSEPTSRTCWSDRWSIWSPKESICPCCVDRGWLAKAWGLNSAESMSMEFIILSIEGPSQWVRPFICKFEKQHILTGCFVLCPFRGQNKYCPNVVHLTHTNNWSHQYLNAVQCTLFLDHNQNFW